jgi:hypothetical protein
VQKNMHHQQRIVKKQANSDSFMRLLSLLIYTVWITLALFQRIKVRNRWNASLIRQGESFQHSKRLICCLCSIIVSRHLIALYMWAELLRDDLRTMICIKRLKSPQIQVNFL